VTSPRAAYKTVWVGYHEIEGLCIKIGAKHTAIRPDGNKQYTLPVIHDPRTNAVVSESATIAEYLDETYPDKPPIFPKGSKALQYTFCDAHWPHWASLATTLLPRTCDKLKEGSKPYFRYTKEVAFGKKFEELSPVGPVRDGHWKGVKDGLNAIDGMMAKIPDQPYIAGDSPSYVDIILASRLMWAKIVLGEDSELWKEVTTWNGGRWDKVMKSMEKYETVV
jgi:glutathione S-transferase